MKHGITGQINAGKSYLANELKKRMNYQIIEIDNIRRHILWDSLKPNHIQLREDLAEIFQLSTLGNHKFLQREAFTNKIFQNSENLQKYSFLATPVIKQYVSEIQEKNSFIVWVFLLEENYDELCNGKTIKVISNNTLDSPLLKHRNTIHNNVIFNTTKKADIEYHRTDTEINDFIRSYL